MKKRKLTIGIVGGLCPLATADIYLKAMKQVKSRHGDADYPDIIISAASEQERRGNRFDNSPARNYDMSHRILYIYQVARELKKHSVDKILVPDFLSYSFADTISDNIQTPLVDIVGILADEIKKRWPRAHRVGLLTTSMSMGKKIFEGKFARAGLQLVYPDEQVQQNMVMEAIYGTEGVKRGRVHGKPGELIRQACEHLFSKGADVIASGITELPLIEREYYPRENYLDCNEVIGRELVHNAKCSSPKSGKHGIIGILGGLGPAATVDIFDKIVKNTPASCDQDHIKVIIENNPQIPDRTAALSGKDEDPSIAMLAAAEKLKDSGADFIIVPCNTAHVFLQAVQQHVRIPILSMIEETAKYIAENFPKVRKAGLLATSGTVGSGVYESPLKRKDIELITPSPESQKTLVMEAIYGKKGIKAGFKDVPGNLLLKAAE
ncbi:MAG: amino acid racemase, partial [Victivallaceae bacterium]|nr:amino acid racemase [Victivallaceae bacterium]